MSVSASLAAVMVLCSCAGSDSPTSGWTVRELPSPAGPGSGEPHLATSNGTVLMSWLEPGDGEDALVLDSWDGEAWKGRKVVARGPDFFVNWADFPSVVQTADGVLAAHWLVRGEEGGYDYGVRTAFSRDRGRSWSEPWTPHEDGTATEHGFVTLLDLGAEGIGMVWLDGRDYAAHEDGDVHPGHPEGPEMALRFRRAVPGGRPGPEVLLDGRACDCCQTDAAHTSRGPVVVYRDRTRDEVRDIYIVRQGGDGWTEPRPVHRDGWVFPACPVNGPAVAAHERRVAVAWFTGARDTARVLLAFSDDAGTSFGDPIRVDDGDPAGRVDVVLREDGTALVSWLERTDDDGEVRVRRIRGDGRRGPAFAVGVTSDGRSSGFPRMVPAGGDRVVLAWTDTGEGESRVRVAVAEPAGSP